ncbi:glycosyltransferase family 2 protein [Belliella kenyensis]|uniref:Glycosyltransferase family 2 protein n=1 Tax=Belliella kenyensis TaxID=1472724 RepID=A0ABV8EPM4_9BACT|nr:glycosyltransferase family A protein [Belliella kenyensis]MCH7402094.1 glycosyltransferase family 2 protein [Belliella kenyensis]MDN3601536.1 glycosyltransferase family A protein [Belliella kenyensis]
MPLISVIIPTYNRAHVLANAIRSVLNQTFEDWELIVVDDGSEDETRELVSVFFDDKRIVYKYQINKGVSAARNFGALKAKGEWLIFLDSDDEMEVDSLFFFSNEILRNAHSLIFGGYNVYIDGEFSDESLPNPTAYFAKLSGTYAIKKTLFEYNNGFDTHLKYSENTEFFHRLDQIEIYVGYLYQHVLNYHKSSRIGSQYYLNQIESLGHILNKHSSSLSKRTKTLYHRIIGVNYLRISDFKNARISFLLALSINPFSFKTIVRFLITYLPLFSKKIYKSK